MTVGHGARGRCPGGAAAGDRRGAPVRGSEQGHAQVVSREAPLRRVRSRRGVLRPHAREQPGGAAANDRPAHRRAARPRTRPGCRRGDRPTRTPVARSGHPDGRARSCASDDGRTRAEGGWPAPVPAGAGRRHPDAVPSWSVRSRVSPLGLPVDPRVEGRPRRDRPCRPAGWRVPGVARELRRSSVEVRGRFAELIGLSIEPRGLAYDGYDELDTVAVALGLAPRALPPIPEIGHEGLDTFIDGIVNNAYSGPGRSTRPPCANRGRRSAVGRGPLRAARAAPARRVRDRSGARTTSRESMSDSVSFDRAAESYDETRRLTPEASRADRRSPPVRAPWAPAMSRDRRRDRA